ncbi:hypothetical protein Trydic_g6535 [Trypoxylus dichotomus]
MVNEALGPTVYRKPTHTPLSSAPELRSENASFTTRTANRKISNEISNAKDRTPLEDQGVCQISCLECDQSYVGQANRRINVRKEEHRNAVLKKEPTSSLAQYRLLTRHSIDLDNTKILAKIENLTTRIIREAIVI